MSTIRLERIEYLTRDNQAMKALLIKNDTWSVVNDEYKKPESIPADKKFQISYDK